MKHFIFEGRSDDLFCETVTGSEIGCFKRSARFKLTDKDGSGVIVTGKYKQTGTWMIGVNAISEEKPVDQWSFSMNPSSDRYRNALLVECPKSVTIKTLK